MLLYLLFSLGIVAVLTVYFFIGKMLNTYRRRLINRCEARNISTNPWPFAIWEGLLTLELLQSGLFTKFLKWLEPVNKMISWEYFNLIVIAVMSLSLILYLIALRKHFLIKIGMRMLRLILDPIYIATLFTKINYDQWVPVYSYNGETPKTYYVPGTQVSGGARAASARPSSSNGYYGPNGYGYIPSTDGNDEAQGYSGSDYSSASYVPEKYLDQYGVQSSGDGYHSAQTSDGRTIYYSGDAAPFLESDVSNINDYGSDESP